MLDVELILQKLESFGFLRLHKITGKYYQIYCPFHSDGNEKKPSHGVLLEDEVRNGSKYPAGFCHCFTCGYVNTLPEMVTELLKLKSIAQSGMDWLVENIPGFESSSDFDYLIPAHLMDDLNASYAVSTVKSMLGESTSYISEDELASYRYTVEYMYERKLTDQIIDMFDVGFDANWVAPNRSKPTPCLTFPVRDESGRTLFVYRRSISSKFFSMPENLTKPVYGLYELQKYAPDTKSVIICESIINALTCWTYGKPAVALMGTSTVYQIEQLKKLGVNQIILGLDPDEAGERAVRKLKKNLKGNALVWSYTGIPTGKDINDLSREEFEMLELE